jgi:hypothetical protein
MEYIRYYIKNLLTNSWLSKTIWWAILATFTCFVGWENLLTLQFIFVWWLLIMLVWTISWTIEGWFRVQKFFRWIFRLVWYYIIVFLWFSLDQAFDTNWVFPFFYWAIITDIINSFLKHASILWIEVKWIKKAVSAIEKKMNNFLSNK